MEVSKNQFIMQTKKLSKRKTQTSHNTSCFRWNCRWIFTSSQNVKYILYCNIQQVDAEELLQCWAVSTSASPSATPYRAESQFRYGIEGVKPDEKSGAETKVRNL